MIWDIPSLDPRPSFRFYITVRRTTGPGTSCLRMRQIFIVFVVGKYIWNENAHSEYTKDAH